ncbi:MAG: CRISPR-associated helicase Cas3' [bacterium]|nr:CRISPR-associated helicase Cas3' [bacterium]
MSRPDGASQGNTPSPIVKPTSEPSFADTFTALTGGRRPYAYQERVDRHLQSAHDLLLTAPTGSGKTLATVAPFFHARRVGRPIADRILYALPLRTLARKLAVDLRPVVERVDPSVRVTVQTGDQPEDDLLQGDIVFTTIDQLLSAYLHVPLSLPRKLDNINAGGLVGALVVFDEVHLLEPARALGTAVHLMENLRGLAQFVLATATLTTAARELLCSRRCLYEDGPQRAEFCEMPALRSRERTWTTCDGPLDATEVLAAHRGGRTLVVANTVRRAQDIGRALLASKPRGCQVIVLHGRFYTDDRKRAEDRVAEIMGPDAPPCDAIVVTTQVIEAGMDISCELLMTEVAPANAIVQRAGRCARYAPPRSLGQVYVYNTLGKDGRRALGPYKGLKGVIEDTWQALPTRPTVLDVAGECTLLEAGLGRSEMAKLETEVFGQLGARTRAERIRSVWSRGDLAAVRELIRDVQAVSVYVVDDVRTVEPARGALALSVPLTTWRAFLHNIDPTSIHGLSESEDAGCDAAWSAFEWRPLRTAEEACLAYTVPTSLARYTRQLGLELGVPSDDAVREPPAGRAPRGTRPHYWRESYRDHVRRVLSAARLWLTKQPVAVERLAVRYGMSAVVVEALVLLAAGLHDVGKLDRESQMAAHEWQRARSRPDTPGEPLAHTDYHPERDRRCRSPFGRHAVEGALASMDLVGSWLLELGTPAILVNDATCVVASAVARHHAPRATDARPFELVEDALGHVVEAFEGVLAGTPREGICLANDGRDASRCLVDPNDPTAAHLWPLYTFVVRGLRLADQAGTAAGAREGANR